MCVLHHKNCSWLQLVWSKKWCVPSYKYSVPLDPLLLYQTTAKLYLTLINWSKKVKLVKATYFLYLLTTIQLYLYIFCSILLLSCIMMLISFSGEESEEGLCFLYNFKVSLFIWVFKVFRKCFEYLWTVFEQLLVVCSLHFEFSTGSLAFVPPLSPLGSLFFFCVH